LPAPSPLTIDAVRETALVDEDELDRAPVQILGGRG